MRNRGGHDFFVARLFKSPAIKMHSLWIPDDREYVDDRSAAETDDSSTPHVFNI